MRNSTYDQFIYAGTLHLGHGDFKAARNYFNMATSYARNHGHTHDEACAEQLSGIALRLAGQYYRSETAFVRALMLALEASDEGLAARIHRDWAMLLMDQGMFAGANDRLIESLAKLRADNVEYWVTRGFIGRVNLLLGRRELAAVIIAEADRHLIDADNHRSVQGGTSGMEAGAAHRTVPPKGRDCRDRAWRKHRLPPSKALVACTESNQAPPVLN
jgi:tetratricopeptide (TPR) repeat protein